MSEVCEWLYRPPEHPYEVICNALLLDVTLRAELLRKSAPGRSRITARLMLQDALSACAAEFGDQFRRLAVLKVRRELNKPHRSRRK